MPTTDGIHFPPNLEADYQASLGSEKLRVARQTCWLCIVLYLAFGLLDVWAIPSALFASWAIRATVTLCTLLVIVLSRRYPQFVISNYPAVIGGLNAIWGVGIEGMVFLSHPTDLAWSVYYAGLMLTLMALYAWTFLGQATAAAIGACIVGGYILIAVEVQGMLDNGQLHVLLANCFFLVSSNIIGVYSLNSRERFSRRAYLLQHALGRDLEMKDEAKRQSDYLAEHDVLTGIPNRLGFVRRINEMIDRAAKNDELVAVLFIDLDDFKPINDRYGHAVGDLVLQIVARRIKSCIRSSDIIARIGGDEFAVGLELSNRKLEFVQQIGGNIVKNIGAAIVEDGRTLAVTASVGAALFPFHGVDADALLAVADMQMYDVKHAGKRSLRIAPLKAESQPHFAGDVWRSRYM